MERISLVMVRPDLWDLPRFDLPEGYWIRTFRIGDEWSWARIEAAAAEFDRPGRARDHFAREFGDHLTEVSRRCHFLLNRQGEFIGTATAWFGTPPGRASHRVDLAPRGGGRSSGPPTMGHEPVGRLHWVAISPESQGRGLAKPLVSAAMSRMAQFHRSAYLTTQTTSFVAIKVYLDFGFVPHIVTTLHRRGWRMMAETLGHPALSSWKGDS
jgi:ribosomal protein S18 acetylase RimI-like enzyme